MLTRCGSTLHTQSKQSGKNEHTYRIPWKLNVLQCRSTKPSMIVHVLLQIFSDAPDSARWIVPIHHVVVHNMVAMATQADEAQRQAGNAAPGKLSAAATYLQSSIFSDTLRKGMEMADGASHLGHAAEVRLLPCHQSKSA